MKMFKSKRQKIRDFLKDKDWQTLEQIQAGADLGRTATKQTLEGLKKELEFENGTWKLKSLPPIVTEPEQPSDETSDPIPPDFSSSVAQEPTLEVSEELHSKGLNAKLDDVQKQLNLVLGMKEKKEKKAKLKKFSLGKLKRYNKGKNRAVIKIDNFQNIKLVKGEYFEGFKVIKVGPTYYPAGAVYTHLWEGKQPCLLVHENSLEPFASSKIYTDAKANGNLVDPQLATIQAAKMLEQEAAEGEKKKMGWMLWVGIAIAGVVVAWLFLGGKK